SWLQDHAVLDAQSSKHQNQERELPELTPPESMLPEDAAQISHPDWHLASQPPPSHKSTPKAAHFDANPQFVPKLHLDTYAISLHPDAQLEPEELTFFDPHASPPTTHPPAHSSPTEPRSLLSRASDSVHLPVVHWSPPPPSLEANPEHTPAECEQTIEEWRHSEPDLVAQTLIEEPNPAHTPLPYTYTSPPPQHNPNAVPTTPYTPIPVPVSTRQHTAEYQSAPPQSFSLPSAPHQSSSSPVEILAVPQQFSIDPQPRKSSLIAPSPPGNAQPQQATESFRTQPPHDHEPSHQTAPFLSAAPEQHALSSPDDHKMKQSLTQTKCSIAPPIPSDSSASKPDSQRANEFTAEAQAAPNESASEAQDNSNDANATNSKAEATNESTSKVPFPLNNENLSTTQSSAPIQSPQLQDEGYPRALGPTPQQNDASVSEAPNTDKAQPATDHGAYTTTPLMAGEQQQNTTSNPQIGPIVQHKTKPKSE
ncbi:MAG: hypothetical protein AAGJ35_10545, partial [Myxococcota bacterium]